MRLSKAQVCLSKIRDIQVTLIGTEDPGEESLIEALLRVYNQVDLSLSANDGDFDHDKLLYDRVSRLGGILQTRFEYDGHSAQVGEGAKIIQGELQDLVGNPELKSAAEGLTIPVVGYLIAVGTYKIGADYITALQGVMPSPPNIEDDHPGLRKKIYDVHHSGMYGTAFKNRLLSERDLLEATRPEIGNERVSPEESLDDGATLNRTSRPPRSRLSAAGSMRTISTWNPRSK
jgi:hypothetical protein